MGTGIAVSMIRKILGTGPVKWLMGNLFLNLLLLGGIFIVSILMYDKKMPVNESIVDFYMIAASLGLWTMSIKNIGGKIYKTLFLAAIPSSFLYFISLQWGKVDTGMASMLFGHGLYLIYSIKSYLSSDEGQLFKTMAEIDKMGNGDTYEKGRQFEEYIASLYRDAGFSASTTTELRKQGKLPESIQKRGGSGDQGVDVVLYNHLTGETVIIQCKHYSSKISNSAVQEIVAAKSLYKAQRAIVVTNQYFTQAAKDLAFENKVVLIDRDGLKQMIRDAKTRKEEQVLGTAS